MSEETETLVNEFSTVEVRSVESGNGKRLEIEAKERGYSIRLSPIQLESLTWQDNETFSEFLSTPFGPEE